MADEIRPAPPFAPLRVTLVPLVVQPCEMQPAYDVTGARAGFWLVTTGPAAVCFVSMTSAPEPRT